MDDLDRLGNALTLATTRVIARRQRRRRTVACAFVALAVFATLTPTHLGPADQPNFFALAIEPAGAAVRCDQPRGQRFHYTDACIPQHPAPQAAR
ncbi:MAG TPA: hypothetical protein VNS09_12825 [Solirubrobacter sp.]|nr:hypothetical protein [Solirubrobacter sp.]